MDPLLVVSVDVIGGREFRTRLVERDLVITRIDCHQHRARVDLLIVLDGYLGYGPTNASCHRCDVGVNLCIISRFASGGRI